MSAPLRSSADLIRADVTAAQQFLHDRMREVHSSAADGSNAQRTAVALCAAVDRAALAVKNELAGRNVAGRAGAVWTEGRLVERWNLLMELSAPWEGEPGWDTARWKYLIPGEDLPAGGSAYDRAMAQTGAPTAFDRELGAL